MAVKPYGVLKRVKENSGNWSETTHDLHRHQTTSSLLSIQAVNLLILLTR
jgi:hypothetical protein